MTDDKWMAADEALSKLKGDWCKMTDNKGQSWLVNQPKNSAPTMKYRVYDGTEHEKARAGCVIINIGQQPLTEFMKASPND